MEISDTISLLKECDSGTKMAISSIDEVIEKIANSSLRDLLLESRKHHASIENDIHVILMDLESEGEDPNPMAKGMSWIKTNMKITMNNSDQTIADLMTEGCDMGVKSLNKYLNQYKAADMSAVKICKKLILIEDELGVRLREYL